MIALSSWPKINGNAAKDHFGLYLKTRWICSNLEITGTFFFYTFRLVFNHLFNIDRRRKRRVNSPQTISNHHGNPDFEESSMIQTKNDNPFSIERLMAK